MTETASHAVRGSASAEVGKGGKYLTFVLGQEEYGLELRRVREIIALIGITPVPMTAAYVRGVMNLRGKVIPVIDLRAKFGMQPTEDHDRKCIIVVDVVREEVAVQMSILVDAVSEVLHIPDADIEDVPAINAGLSSGFIHGMAKAKGGVKILLEIDAVLAAVDPIDLKLAPEGPTDENSQPEGGE